MDILNIQHVLERFSSLLKSEYRTSLQEYKMQPVHFEVLQYLSVCNRYSNTPKAVTEYLGQTKGTVSQSLILLEAKGLIKKQANKNDKRVVNLALTAKGKGILNKILPSPSLSLTSELLTKKEFEETERLLISLLKKYQQANDFKMFGQCSTCIHNNKLKSGSYLCNLTKEPLSKLELEKICIEHEIH